MVVRRIGLRILSLFLNIYSTASPKIMENNVERNPASPVRGKSDVGTQCTATPPRGSETPDGGRGAGVEDSASDAIKRRPRDRAEYAKKPKKAKLEQALVTRPGFTDERFDETSYYFENGLRKVYPYYFTFTTYTKGRWVGRTLMEVFGKEFRAHSADEYERHIEKGSLTINNERVTADYVLKHKDLLSNVVHRHEVPVTDDPIDIIHMDSDIVVVNKPASIPVHPCGRYRHNTIVFLLAKEHNLRDLKTVHRLDRLTSGVLMLGRTQNEARRLEAQIRNREVRKEYVCRVEGRFPESAECDQPIQVLSYKIGVCKVTAAGKQCSTSFTLVGYNPEANASVVLCTPHSGRMHQIRVHLQYLGYPIENDPLYNDEIFGPEKGRGGDFGKTDEQLVQDLIYAHNAENWLKTDDDGGLPSVDGGSVNPPPLEKRNACNDNATTQTGINLPDVRFDKNKFSVDPYCQECKIHYKDPKPKDLVMYLHAFKYSGPDWSYETSMPAWADVDWKKPR